MNISTFLSFCISASLLTTMLASSIVLTPNSYAQVNNTAIPTSPENATAMNSNSTNKLMIIKLDDDRKKQFTMDHKYNDKNRNYDKINGTVNIMDTTYQAIASKFNITLAQAISSAEQTAGNNSYAMSASTEEKDGYLVYSIVLGNPEMKFHKVTVDPGNGQVLQTKELSMMDWMMMMHKEKMQENKGKQNTMMEMHQGYGKDKGYTHK